MLQYIHSLTIDTNYQNASAFLLAFRMGKEWEKHNDLNYTVQLSDGAKFHTITQHKDVFYHNDIRGELYSLLKYQPSQTSDIL